MTTIDRLRELEAAATPGPWQWDGDNDVMVTAPDERWVANVGNWGRQNAAQGVGDMENSSLLSNIYEMDQRDAALIAEARNALPALLDIAKAARAAPDALLYKPPMTDDGFCNECATATSRKDHDDACPWAVLGRIAARVARLDEAKP